MKLSKQSGIGLVEILAAVAVLGAATYTIMYGFDSLEKNKNRIDESMNIEYLLSGIVESARSNITMEKIDFQGNEQFLSLSAIEEVKESLKMCWIRNGLTPILEGMNCKARVGYVITPYRLGTMEYRGLYQATVRITHEELFPATFKQYTFIIRGP